MNYLKKIALIITIAIAGVLLYTNYIGGNYIVQSGDNLYNIARNNGVSVNDLVSLNSQISDPNIIYPGQTIYTQDVTLSGISGGSGIGTASYWYGDGSTIFPVDSTWNLDMGSGNFLTTGTLGAGNTTITGFLNTSLPAVGTDSYFKLSSATASTFNTRLGTTASNQYAWFTNLYYTGAAFAKDDTTKGAWRMNQVVGATSDSNNAFNIDYFPIGSLSSNAVLTIIATATGGNATFTGTLGAGAITGTSLIKSGGTSSQFLKADGSVDTNTYYKSGDSPTFANITDSTMTLGSVLFAGTSGLISQNNAKFFWDNTNGVLSIGTNSPPSSVKMYVNGAIRGTSMQSSGDAQYNQLQAYSDSLETFPIKIGLRSNDNITHEFAFRGDGSSPSVGSFVFIGDGTGGIVSSSKKMRIYYDETHFATLASDSLGRLILGINGLTLPAGTATAGTAPLKFTISPNPTTAVLLTTPEAGAFEPVNDDISYTILTGTARKQIVMMDGSLLTDNTIPVAHTNGRLINSTITDNGTNVGFTKTLNLYNNIATEGYGVPAIVDDVALTAQSASIGSTNFTNAGVAGNYRLNYYLNATTLNIGATSIMLTVAWTDDAGATTTSSIALPLTALGRTSGIFYIQLASGNVSYSTTLIDATGLARYSLYMSLERLK